MPVTDTSRSAYHGLRDDLPRRERLVWDALSKLSDAPTAYELTEHMKRSGEAFDLNSVRPRLTSMLEKGCVRRLGKRICAITGRKVYTWQVVHGRPPVKATKRKAEKPAAVDAALF